MVLLLQKVHVGGRGTLLVPLGEPVSPAGSRGPLAPGQSSLGTVSWAAQAKPTKQQRYLPWHRDTREATVIFVQFFLENLKVFSI